MASIRVEQNQALNLVLLHISIQSQLLHILLNSWQV